MSSSGSNGSGPGDDGNANLRSPLSTSPHLMSSKSLPNLSSPKYFAPSAPRALLTSEHNGLLLSDGVDNCVTVPDAKNHRDNEVSIPPRRTWSPNTTRYWALQYLDEDALVDDRRTLSTSSPQSKLLKSDEISASYFEIQRKFLVDARDYPRQPNEKRRSKSILNLLTIRRRNQEAIHRVDGRLLLPAHRTDFICKVMCVKFVEWVLATAVTITSFYVPFVPVFATKRVWFVCVPVCVYMSLFILLRYFKILRNPTCCTATVIIYTMCLASIGSLTYSAYSTAFVPTVMMTLTLFHGFAAVLSGFARKDFTKDSIIPTVLLLDTVFSLLTFVLIHKMMGNEEIKIAQQFGSIWFPAVMSVQSLSLIEVAELKAIVDGMRIDVSPRGWIVVGAYLM